MMAEVVPPARDLATKADITDLRSEMLEAIHALRADFEALRADFEALRADVVGMVEGLRADLKALEGRMFRWALGFFLPMWVTTLGALLAVVLRA